MSIYSIALFFHIVGALGLSVALGLEWTSLRQIHSAALPEQVRMWTGILKGTNKVGFPSMLMMVITGIYMTVIGWGRAPWLVVTMVALVLVIMLARVTAPRLKALEQSLVATNDSFLWFSVQTRVAIVLGITFLKIAKPELGGSLLTIGVAIVLGLASTLFMSRRARVSNRLAG